LTARDQRMPSWSGIGSRPKDPAKVAGAWSVFPHGPSSTRTWTVRL
jgi:hypothetical protein